MRECMTKLAKNLTGKDISSLGGDMEMMWLALGENVVAAVIDTMHLHYPKFELIREERCQGRRITRCLNTNVPPCAAVARPRKRKADDRFSVRSLCSSRHRQCINSSERRGIREREDTGGCDINGAAGRVTPHRLPRGPR